VQLSGIRTTSCRQHLFSGESREAVKCVKGCVPPGARGAAESAPACRLVPDVAFWGRSRSARSVINEANKMLLMRENQPSASSDESEEPKYAARVLFPSSRLVDGKSIGAYRDSFPNAFSTKCTCLGSKVEVFLVPKRVVCVLCGSHPGQIAMNMLKRSVKIWT
jgi:hypothetical protein